MSVHEFMGPFAGVVNGTDLDLERLGVESGAEVDTREGYAFAVRP